MCYSWSHYECESYGLSYHQILRFQRFLMRDAHWIFGYGSLMWHPGFEFSENRPAAITGWMRRFWQGSTNHRGVPGAPGRVVTLMPDESAVCRGMAYRVDSKAYRTAVETLREQREDLEVFCSPGPPGDQTAELIAAWVSMDVSAGSISNDLELRADQRFLPDTSIETPDFQRHVIPLLGRLGCNGRRCWPGPGGSLCGAMGSTSGGVGGGGAALPLVACAAAAIVRASSLISLRSSLAN